MSDFKICIVGCGFMTQKGHGPSCAKYAAEHDGVVLAACCDINPAMTQKICTEFGFLRAYTDYIEMVECEKPDEVLVVTPDTLTRDVSVALLERKIPVLLEKPPGLNRQQAQAIHDASVKNNTPARVAFNRRYTPLLRALKDEMEQVGEQILDISCMFVRVGRKDPDFSTTAIHGIDTVKFLAGCEYESASFCYQDISFEEKPVTNISMSAKLENGASASLTFVPCGGCVVERITVNLTGHTFFLQLPVWGGVDAPGRLVCLKNGAVYKTVEGGAYTLHESNGYYDESRMFFDALRAGETVGCDVLSGLSSVEIAHAIRQRKAVYEALVL